MYFQFDSRDYFFVINLINEILILFMIPYIMKKSYSNNFNLEKDYILYTAPISLSTIFFYKYIKSSSRSIMPIVIITMPNIIAYGIVNNYSVIQIIFWLFTLAILMLFASTVIQLLTVISTAVIKARYRAAFVNTITSAISIVLIVLILAVEKIYGNQDIFAYLKTDNIIKKVFVIFDMWEKMCVSIDSGIVNIVSVLVLIIGCIISIVAYFGLYKLMYLRGEFIRNNSDTSIRMKNEQNVFYILLKNLFKNTYTLIYKDVLLLTRSIEKWGVILKPIIFTPLPFLGSSDFFGYKNISEILIILFLWLSSDLAVYSIKSEGTMLEQLKNSSFNIRNIICSKIVFSSMISIFIYLCVNIFLLLFLNFTFYQMFMLVMCIIAIILTTSIVRVSCTMLYAKEDNTDDEYGISLGFVGEVLSYLCMLGSVGVIIVVFMFFTYTAVSLNLLICILSTLFISAFTFVIFKICIKMVSEKVIS